MKALAIDAKHDDRPIVIQGCAIPIFSGGGDNLFGCRHCGNLLAANYNPRSLIAIDIQCFRCGTVSRTDRWPDGESLPSKLISTGSFGRLLLKSPVSTADGIAISCDAEIERVRSFTAAPYPNSNDINLTHQGLELLEAELNLLTEQEFAKMLASTKRAMAVGNVRFTKCPPAWAVQYLRSRVGDDFTRLDDDDVMAICYLHQLRHIINRWRQHYFFPLVTRSFCSEFHHAITMLSAAAYLSDVGNEIGITDTKSATGRSPDLYINTRVDGRLSIEVKAPDLFFWPAPKLNLADTEKHIHKALRSARDQLTGEEGGIVVVGASHPGEYNDIFAKAIENVVNSGKVSTRIAAIVGVCHLPFINPGHGKVESGIQANVTFEINPRFPNKDIFKFSD